MLNDVMARLAGMGFTVSPDDEWVLMFCVDKVTNHIKNSCNVSEVPTGLHETAVDLVCGEYLQGKFRTGQMGDVSQAVSKIKEGDTDITFVSGMSDAELIASLIADLRGREVDFAAYRRIRW